ncbi:YbaB/EbfC family nucleoid-associated protein [Streptomyces spongiicola]|uniref:Nucleoid-associated protein SSP531S_58000 n=1 Tax=Streptomyces spongiicola TaxID=1690221 RepID=A0A388T707_9ACTN|nr:YbaB/EbfC family nucleoid-associated protein [Streptomyces spongiicola]
MPTARGMPSSDRVGSVYRTIDVEMPGVTVIPGGGQPNMQQLLQQAQKMQQDLARAQEELAATEVDGQAGGGLVKATVTGSGDLRGLVIDPRAVDPDDTETLADLVVAAVQAANENAQQLQQQKLGPLAQGLGGGIPGLPF